MVVSEKALISAMKAEYKGDGYKVAKRGHGDEAVLEIQAAMWSVEITWPNIPSKVLALIVEHLKTLPASGEAFQARKGETAAIIYEMMEDMPEIDDSAKLPLAHRTPLTYQGMEAWQLDINSTCVFVQAGAATMLLDYGRAVRWAEGGLFLEGKATKAYVLPEHYTETEPEREVLNFLSGNWWR